MRCCSPCTAVVMRLAGKIEEKSGPGAIFGKYRCYICWQGFDVQVDHPHNLNVGGSDDDFVELVKKARAEVGAVVECVECQKIADRAAGKATKSNIVFHNCGRPN